MRKIVEGTGNYWLSSFEIGRIEKTKNIISETIAEYVSFNSALSAKFVDTKQNFENNSQEISSDLLELVTDLLASGDISSEGNFSNYLLECVLSCWRISGSEGINYVKLCEEGKGEWDVIISSLTPDLPCMIADFAANELASYDRVTSFWSLVSLKLDDESIKSIIMWYESAVKDLTGENKSVPSWMI
ncbi:MAG: hypothetical protein P0Y59_16145 [Candidatus Sphingomonas phytovorans]|nr:hypothetical protein [Sphingomonas sp.]WEJ98469.1 MAG: hypothetical protein P0Y59_16145 [Sphingomonas sp.]